MEYQAASAAGTPPQLSYEALSHADAHTPLALANGNSGNEVSTHQQRQRRSASHIATTPPSDPHTLMAATPPVDVPASSSFRGHYTQVTASSVSDMVTPVHRGSGAGTSSAASGFTRTPNSGNVAAVKAKLQRLKGQLLARAEGAGTASRTELEGKIGKLERLIQEVEDKQVRIVVIWAPGGSSRAERTKAEGCALQLCNTSMCCVTELHSCQ